MLYKREIIRWAETQSLHQWRLHDKHVINLNDFHREVYLYLPDKGNIYIKVETREEFPLLIHPRSTNYFASLLKDIGKCDIGSGTLHLNKQESLSELLENINTFVGVLRGKHYQNIDFIRIREDKIYKLCSSNFIKECSFKDAEGYNFCLPFGRAFEKQKLWLCPKDAESFKVFGRRLRRLVKDFFSLEIILQEELGSDYYVSRYKCGTEIKIFVTYKNKCVYVEPYCELAGFDIYYPYNDNKLRAVFIELKKLNDNLFLNPSKIIQIIKSSLEQNV